MSAIDGLRPLLSGLFVGGVQVIFLTLTFGAMVVRNVVAVVLPLGEGALLFLTTVCQFFAALFAVELGVWIADGVGLGASRLLMLIPAGFHLVFVWWAYDDAAWEERMETIAARYPGADEVIDLDSAELDRWATWAAFVATAVGLVIGIYLNWDLPVG